MKKNYYKNETEVKLKLGKIKQSNIVNKKYVLNCSNTPVQNLIKTNSLTGNIIPQRDREVHEVLINHYNCTKKNC